jgi:GTP-binding protein EngB required for normal cell division
LASNYEKSVYKQLEETLKKFDIIIEENKQIKTKIEVLEFEHSKEIKEFKTEIIMLNAKHQNEVAVLNTKIDKLTDENQKLKDIINKDSGNSSKRHQVMDIKKFTTVEKKAENQLAVKKVTRAMKSSFLQVVQHEYSENLLNLKLVGIHKSL